MPASNAREPFADLLDEGSVRGQRVDEASHDQAVAVLVTRYRLAALEALEAPHDVDSAREALADSDVRLAWAELKDRGGLCGVGYTNVFIRRDARGLES